MENKFKRIIENLEELLVLDDEIFSNELILDEHSQCSLLGTVTFSGVYFKAVDLADSTFVNCRFKNCRFKGVMLQKCNFWSSTFENCQIEKSSLTKASFHKGNFENCTFIDSKLSFTYFSEFDFIETKFNDSNLNSIGAESIKIYKLNQCSEIQESYNLRNFLENINSDG